MYLNFMKLFEFKIYLGRSPLKPPLPQNKFGEVVEVIMLLYYFRVCFKKIFEEIRFVSKLLSKYSNRYPVLFLCSHQLCCL